MRTATLLAVLAALGCGTTEESGPDPEQIREACASQCGQAKGQCDGGGAPFALESCEDQCADHYEDWVDCSQACSGTVAEGCACTQDC